MAKVVLWAAVSFALTLFSPVCGSNAERRVIRAELCEKVTESVSYLDSVLIEQTLDGSRCRSASIFAYTVTATVESDDDTYPLSVTVRQNNNGQSVYFRLPAALPESFEEEPVFTKATRTICPLETDGINTTISIILADIVTSSPISKNFTFQVVPIYIDDIIRPFPEEGYTTYKNGFATHHTGLIKERLFPFQPRVHYVEFPDNFSINVKVTSDDSECAVVSVQQPICPLNQKVRNIKTDGIFQTMTTTSVISVTDQDIPEEKFFLVIVAADKEICDPNHNDSSVDYIMPYRKMVEVSVTTVERSRLDFNILRIGIYILLGIILVLATLLLNLCRTLTRGGKALNFLNCSKDMMYFCCTSTCRLPVSMDKYTKATETLSPGSTLHESGFFWSLFSTMVFYLIPCYQMAIAVFKNIAKINDEKSCFYNFECALRDLSYSADIRSLNAVFASFLPALFGGAFLFALVVRNIAHSCRKSPQSEEEIAEKEQHGIPENYTLYYIFGLTMIADGITSAMYHICPNISNIQNDYIFTYTGALLLTIKVIGKRGYRISQFAGLFSVVFVEVLEMIARYEENEGKKGVKLVLLLLIILSSSLCCIILFTNELIGELKDEAAEKLIAIIDERYKINWKGIIVGQQPPNADEGTYRQIIERMKLTQTKLTFGLFNKILKEGNYVHIGNKVFGLLNQIKTLGCLILKYKHIPYKLNYRACWKFVFIVTVNVILAGVLGYFGYMHSKPPIRNAVATLFFSNLTACVFHYSFVKFVCGEHIYYCINPFLICCAVGFWVTAVVINSKVFDPLLSPAMSRELNSPCFRTGLDTHDISHLLNAMSLLFFAVFLVQVDDGEKNVDRKELVAI